jgi:hypothetical protein
MDVGSEPDSFIPFYLLKQVCFWSATSAAHICSRGRCYAFCDDHRAIHPQSDAIERAFQSWMVLLLKLARPAMGKSSGRSRR